MEVEKEWENEQEYKERICYFVTVFRNGFCISPPLADNTDFHPRLFTGTHEEYDNILNKYYFKGEKNGKYETYYKYYTLCEYNKAVELNKTR